MASNNTLSCSCMDQTPSDLLTLRFPPSHVSPTSKVTGFCRNPEPAVDAQYLELEHPFTCYGIGRSNPNSFKSKTPGMGLGILCLKLRTDVDFSLAGLVPTVV